MRRFRWFGFGTGRDVERDVQDEIEFHLEHTIAELRMSGWSAEAAEREAHRRFGDVARYRRNLREIGEGHMHGIRRRERFANALQDLRQALRALRREPALTLGITVTLALGIGANSMMFGVLGRLLFTPPAHVQDVDSLRRVATLNRFRGNEYFSPSREYPDWHDFRKVGAFEDVAVWDNQELTLGYGIDARRIRAAITSANLFPLLGVDAWRGRVFGIDEDRIDGEPLVVVGHEFWSSALGSEPEIIGSTLDINEREHTVIGIAPPGFTGVDLAPVDVWLPLHVAAPALRPDVDLSGARDPSWTYFWLQAVARLRPGVSDAAALAEADAVYEAAVPDSDDFQRSVVFGGIVGGGGPRAANDPVVSDESRVSLWLSGVSAIVLLVACANVANMLLTRGLRRQGEIGVRLALGIPRHRLLRQLLAEGMLLALLGGAAALLVASTGGRLVQTALFPDILWPEGALHPRQLAFTMVVALCTGLLASVLPAWQWSRDDVVSALRGSSRTASGSSRTRVGLLVLQAALSTLLLVGAGLFVRSLQEVNTLDLGLDAPETLLVALPEMSNAAGSDEGFSWPVDEALEQIRSHPAVTHATAAITFPFGSSWGVRFALPDRDQEELPQTDGGGPYIHPVSPEYFATLGLQILQGRPIDASDHAGSERVVVLNQTMAELLWPGESALGRCVLLGDGVSDGTCTTVVGVAENARRSSLRESPTQQYYVPIQQHLLDNRIAFMARVDPRFDVAPVARDLRRQVLGWAPDTIRHITVEAMQNRIDPKARSWSMGASLFTIFGVLATVVAAIGLYGALAFDVAQRTREIGVRAALGATATTLRAMVVANGLRLTAIGVGLGAVAALLLGPRLEPLLFEVSPREPTVLGGVALLLLVVASVASWVPALRATRVDPNTALRD